MNTHTDTDLYGFLNTLESVTSVMNYHSDKYGHNNAVLFKAPCGQQIGLNLINEMHAAHDLLEALKITLPYMDQSDDEIAQQDVLVVKQAIEKAGGPTAQTTFDQITEIPVGNDEQDRSSDTEQES